MKNHSFNWQLNKNLLAILVLATMTILSFKAVANPDAKYNFQQPTYIPTVRAPETSYSAPADYTVTVHNLSTATLRITGTCTSLAGAVQVTNDNTNWTDVPLLPVAGGSPVLSFSAAGFWKFDVSGVTKARAHITALTAACAVSIAGTQGIPVLAVSNDPCQDPRFVKSSVVINSSSSATTNLVSAVTGKAVYVCGVTLSAVGTNPTVTFKYGTTTTTACDTGTTALTGDITPSATIGMVNVGSGGNTVFSTPTSVQLCSVTGATTDVDGVLTFVQK